MWSNVWNPSNRKVLGLNIVSAFMLNLFLEWMERKSLSALLVFIEDRTFIFLFNVLIIFMTFSIVFLVKKKYFAFGIIFAGWGIMGLVNGIILMSRKTPFTAVDLTIAKSIIPILNNYFSVFEIIGMIILVTALIAALVTLFLYCPDARRSFHFRSNCLVVGIFLLFFGICTYFGVGRGLLISKFDNLIAGYEDYGVAYGFCVTLIDQGIDRPIDYSRDHVKKVVNKMDKKLKKIEKNEKESKTPNIIFIQLESFFDITDVKNIQLSQDPLPNLHALQKETTHGYITVPVYGAGTINTEFEMITGMNTAYFGTGEYPYRSILHKTTCESMAYWLKDYDYTSTVLHNNNLSFYDRDKVFSNLGFFYFISSENMDIKKRNDAGWSTDAVLKKYIMDTMKKTPTSDYIYTISVQGHGDYPDHEVKNSAFTVDGDGWTDSYRNMVTYYVNQISQMDTFVGDLIDELSDFEEETILVFYGDHLPSLNWESGDLKNKSKYKTPYIIWDNFGYNSSHYKKESGNMRSYQMPSKILSQIGIHEGVMNRYHQTMKESKNYKKNMKLLQYDILYGANFANDGQEHPVATKVRFNMDQVVISKIKTNDKKAYIMGSYFTEYSRVYINGNEVPSRFISNTSIKVDLSTIHDGDKIVIKQVNKTNEKIILNKSEPFIVDGSQIQSVVDSNPVELKHKEETGKISGDR